ncbi:deaminase [Streptomyces sp. 150FB]|uniref:dihydrofolate reductase family protein n=1 Tax=Streptomyces sp. 150FB TaxID=1576605 RepID=UPI00058957D6|nr:dihydrofolate reductase family protein [Streptomyces sp. 150FB]KIF77718.1 deaminase [Streptomyces sp. 150FB]
MTKVYSNASMSLDGYISGPEESGFDRLFTWYGNGDVIVETTHEDLTFALSPVSATAWHDLVEETGALIVGRKLFDLTSGWEGNHPIGCPVVVLTHREPEDWPHKEAAGSRFTFVTDGIVSAVERAKAIAGGKAVGVSAGTIARQCLDAGLLDEVRIDLVPVLLGGGTPYFEQIENAPVELEGPISTDQGHGVTHLRYRVPPLGRPVSE